MRHSLLKQTMLNSPLNNKGVLRSTQRIGKKSLALSLTLTSLVDAFSILVIYLLVNTSADNQFLKNQKGLELPMASHAKTIQKGFVVTIDNNQYQVGGEFISLEELQRRLYEAKKMDSELEPTTLVIQADRRIDYQIINPLIIASSQVGVNQIKFAVIQQEGGT